MKTTHSLLAGTGSRRRSETLSRHLRTSVRLTGIVALAAVMGGCATRYDYGVSAINQSTIGHGEYSYRLVDARPDAVAGDAVFERVARDVRTALSSKGLYAVPEGVAPRFVIEVDFAVSAPIITREVKLEPVYVLTPRVSSLSAAYDHDLRSGMLESRFLENREVVQVTMRYEKFLRLTARTVDPVSGDPARQAWSVFVSNHDASGDLTRHVRLMVAAAMDQVGADLTSEQAVTLTMRDGRVAFISRGMDDPDAAVSAGGVR